MQPSPGGESKRNELPNSAVPGDKIIPVCCICTIVYVLGASMIVYIAES